jgi:hypothetical protein
MRKGLFALFLMVSVISCTTREICDESNQSELVARFKVDHGEMVSDTVLTGVSAYGIRTGEVFTLLYDSVNASRIVLPLDPSQVSSTFVIDFSGRSDTLTIHHNTEYYLISYNCGFAAMFTLEDIESTRHVIRGDEIIKEVIDAELEQNEEHIWLFF